MKNLLNPFVELVALAPLKSRPFLIAFAMIMMVIMVAIIVDGLAHTVAGPALASSYGAKAIWDRVWSR